MLCCGKVDPIGSEYLSEVKVIKGIADHLKHAQENLNQLQKYHQELKLKHLEAYILTSFPAKFNEG